MSYRQIITEDIRLHVLRAMAQEPDYALNDYVLRRALQLVGHDIGGDRLRTELHWLAEQGLITVDPVSEHTLVAKLTPRGEDVGLGRAHVPGVARPRPGER